MLDAVNKYNFLKKRLVVGEVVQSKVIKKITNDRAVANIKGYDVVVKSDMELIENTRHNFYISGFNEKEKTIILKSVNNKTTKSLQKEYNQLIIYIKNFLTQNKIPVNEQTIQIAEFLYLKDRNINIKVLNYIYNHLKYFQDIPLLYHLFHLSLDHKNLLLLLERFQLSLKNKKQNITKEKNKITDNLDDVKRFIFNERNEDNIKKLKSLLKNNNIINDLLQLKKDNNLNLFLYPLIQNTKNSLGFILLFSIKDEYHPVQFNMNFNEDIISLRLNFCINENKLNYHFLFYLNESKSILSIFSNNNNLIKIINQELEDFKKIIMSKISDNVEIFVKRDMLYNNNKELDIYI